MAEEKPKFDRAAVLARTDEEKQADADAQAEAKERLAHLVSDSIPVAHYRNAIGAEISARKRLDYLYDNLIPDTEADEAAAFEAIWSVRSQLADALFWQGKFEAAVNYADSHSGKTHEYKAFDKAFDNLNQPLCECPPMQFANKHSAKGTSVPSRREIQRVYVGELEKEVKFIKCDQCRKLFAQTC